MVSLWIMAITHRVLCSVMGWSVRCGIKKTQEKLRKTRSILLTAPRDGGRACQRGPRGGDTRVIRRQERGEGLGHGLYWGFPGRTRQGGVNIIGLASWNTVSGLWVDGWSLTAWHLALALGPLRQMNITCWCCGPDRGGLPADWSVCMLRACIWPGPLLSLRIGWLERRYLSPAKRFVNMSKHHNIQKVYMIHA